MPDLAGLCAAIQLLHDVADVARHKVTATILPREDYLTYMHGCFWRVPTPQGRPLYAGVPVLCGDTLTVIVEPRPYA